MSAVDAAKTHCPKGHEYVAENTYTNQQGHRQCRTCKRDQWRAWKERSRANRKVIEQDPNQRFWDKVGASDSGDCWVWLGTADRKGYGSYRLDGNGRTAYAHRVAYELMVGEIPDGLVLDHLCRNPRCVNPNHLEPVTSRVNTLRGTCPAAVNATKTHCKRGHEFTPENTRPAGRRGRCCITCAREYGREWYLRKKAAASAEGVAQ